ncbi:hypothetical protein DPMN_088307 [Dreissena polymorpha]|uniref:Uncharacterized protein n=1 Tax=Dreissena polymorpha TaxID=45954 RepID=A0A9D4KVY5_DREPO|nr:hypothetical protein DPMN_088307 [Dreissena polymorpha]
MFPTAEINIALACWIGDPSYCIFARCNSALSSGELPLRVGWISKCAPTVQLPVYSQPQ